MIRWRLLWLIVRWFILRLLYNLRLTRRFPYNPFAPAEQGGGGTGSMATPQQALDFMSGQSASGSTAWYNLCEKLCRSSYRLNGMYDSAEKHSKAIPSARRYGQEAPSKGDIILYENGGYGHIVVATGNGWECWTNDYTGKGKVGKADARNLVSWCGAYKWYVADAWWSSTFWQDTHDAPPDTTPVPPSTGDDDMDYAECSATVQQSIEDGWEFLTFDKEIRDTDNIHYQGPTWSMSGRRFEFDLSLGLDASVASNLSVRAVVLSGETIKNAYPATSFKAGPGELSSVSTVLAGYCPKDQRVRIQARTYGPPVKVSPFVVARTWV